MMSDDEPHFEGALLHFLRRRLRWGLARLSQAAGPSLLTLKRYENGTVPLPNPVLLRLAAAMGYSGWEVQLYGLLVEGRKPALPGSEDDGAPGQPSDPLFRAVTAEQGVLIAHGTELDLHTLAAKSAGKAQRRHAARTFQTWIGRPRAEQRFLVETHPDFQTQGMVEQIALASERAASKDTRLPLHFAQLALKAAEILSGPAGLRSAIQGWAWAFVGNARRVGGSLREADRAFAQSNSLWREGSREGWLFLDAWRLPDLEASLRRDQRRWRECLALSDRALQEAPPSALGRILIKKGFALEQMGESKKALQALEEAAPQVKAGRDRELRVVLLLNLAVSLTALGDHSRARHTIDEARKLAIELGLDLHLVRCTWISGRIQGESGNPSEAVALLSQARRDFTTRLMPLDAAGVALDEAIHLLKLGEAESVSELAGEVAWIFAAEGVGEDPLKALRLFYEAARTQTLTLEIARQARERFLKSA